jgi:hypothetical protein
LHTFSLTGTERQFLCSKDLFLEIKARNICDQWGASVYFTEVWFQKSSKWLYIIYGWSVFNAKMNFSSLYCIRRNKQTTQSISVNLFATEIKKKEAENFYWQQDAQQRNHHHQSKPAIST